MPANKKPRRKYKPKAQLVNPIEYVLETISPLRAAGSYLLDLKLQNHSAMTELLAGRATKTHMNTLIAMSNICEALQRRGFGVEYKDVTTEGRYALLSVLFRAVEKLKFVPTGPEISMLNTLMELHDAQMDVITVEDMDKALILAKREIRRKHAVVLPPLPKELA